MESSTKPDTNTLLNLGVQVELLPEFPELVAQVPQEVVREPLETCVVKEECLPL